VIEIDVDELAERLSEGARLIDVRETDEYESGHVPGAISIPLATVPEHLDQLDATGPTYMICGSGGRSRRACEFVEGRSGFQTVNIDGGTKAWIASGRPTVAGDRPA
jgi:rhodanese-related sulfurtransferase